MTNNQSYVDVLSAAPRLVLFGTLAMFTGDIANNYVLAKMKVWTSGRYISGRFVVSTLCGQTVNTAVFYIFALWGLIPTRILTKSIIAASLAKGWCGTYFIAGNAQKYPCGSKESKTWITLTVQRILIR